MPVPLTPAAGKLRFAEDIMSRGGKGTQKKKMKKKGTGTVKETDEDAARRAARRGGVDTGTEEDEEVV